MKFIDVATYDIQLISSKIAWHYKVIPKLQENGSIHLYCDDPQNKQLEEELQMILGKNIILHQADQVVIENSLKKHYYTNHGTDSSKNATQLNSEGFIEKLIVEAINLDSSDIHIETKEESGRVRYRVDGKLIDRFSIKKEDYPGVINKIKIQSKLDISEKRLPQDGRMTYKGAKEEFDIRVSILPTMFGEKAVLRILDGGQSFINLDEIGMSSDQLKEYLISVSKINGIILISGPTGSGKTTTLYTTLKYLNQPHFNIVTIEDPIEYTLEGINQVQLKEGIGLTFSKALRTFLRQDPDIIMLGEIRDPETAKMAIRAALTGHLVLSTVHTNSALGTISRLLDMDIPGYLIADTLNLCLAQRLIRLLCNDCKQASKVEATILPVKFQPMIQEKAKKTFNAVGCPNCHYTGYKGRTALFDILTVDNQLKELIKSGSISSDNLPSKIKTDGLDDMAFQIFLQGKTSLEEIMPILLTGM